MTENIIAMGAIIGLINGIKLLENPDKKSFYYFLGAVLTGLVFGYFKVFGLTVETGIIAGLSSSGLYKIASRVGGMQ